MLSNHAAIQLVLLAVQPPAGMAMLLSFPHLEISANANDRPNRETDAVRCRVQPTPKPVKASTKAAKAVKVNSTTKKAKQQTSHRLFLPTG